MTAFRPSIGLVLGAGGVAGAAWHAGVLAALEDRGWDARTADMVVGTSAGAGTAATLRLGVPASDLYAGTCDRPMSDVGRAYVERVGPPVASMPEPRGRRLPRPVAPTLAMREIVSGHRFRPLVAAAAMLPEGRIPTDFLGDRIRAAHDEPWPDRPTWICAVRLSDGERVVFGRDVDDAHLATAVQASSAIPGFFAPVHHGDTDYIDGAVHSPTNADLVAELAFDAVVVSSPMSATRAAIVRPSWSGARGLHAMTLAREVRAVRNAGTPVLVLQPGPEAVDAIGLNTMDTDRRRDIAEVAYETAQRVFASSSAADSLRILTS